MLKISNLSFSYQNQDVFTQVNLTLPNQGKVAIIGDNGAGKSTLLQLIAGHLRPDNGSIKVDGSVGLLSQLPNATNLSGGERTRNALARLFASNYDVLLLDEPTNNLDSDGIDWLISYLYQYHGLALIASHDRDFMNQVAERTIELKDGNLSEYPGNYSDFLYRQQQSESQTLAAYQKATKTKAALKAQITNAKTRIRNKSRHFDKIKDENPMAFKLKRNHAEAVAGKLIRTANTQIAKLNQVNKPVNRKIYQANISAAQLKKGRILTISDLAKSYGNKILFQNLSLELYAGERLQITGNNGSGKTTLFRIIMHELEPDHGTIRLANNLSIGYIAQDIYGLELTQNFLSQADAPTTEIFMAAATMDLEQHDLKKNLSQLSRGQLTKMAFLKIILSPVDLLILDEPTNHLDIRARENIEKALINYRGAILFATHDQAFARALTGNDASQASRLNLSPIY